MSMDTDQWMGEPFAHWQVSYLCDNPACAERHKRTIDGRCRQDARDFFRLNHPDWTILDIEPIATYS